MTLQLGQFAPDFTQTTTDGDINFHDWLDGRWAVLFSHPRDFTPVCTTELAEVARLKPEFDKRDVRVIGLSVDPLASHQGWQVDIEETQRQKLNFPIIADHDRKVATLYGMIHPGADPTATVRSVFVIDPRKRIRLTFTYPSSTGRSFAELLRVIDSLQLTDAHGVVTPADWKPGGDVIILPSLSNADAAESFPRGWRELRPYLRVVEQPPLAYEAIGRLDTDTPAGNWAY